MPKGTFQFPGIPPQIVLGASFTVGHGMTPSVCTVRIPANTGYAPQSGTMQFDYDNQSIRFTDCMIDYLTAEVHEDGRRIWTLAILDRRWRWRFGKIDGAYNTRLRNGTDVWEQTRRSVRDLVELCFKAIGEEGYDLGDLPTDQYPEVNWSGTVPMEAAFALCEQYNMRPVIGDDNGRNLIHVVKVGVGRDLPTNIPQLANSYTFDPPEKPGRIVILCGPSAIQFDLPLKAVGLDLDGGIKPIDQLSYKPIPFNPLAIGSGFGINGIPFGVPLIPTGSPADSGAWNSVLYGFYDIKAAWPRMLATSSVYKWYVIDFDQLQIPGMEQAAGDNGSRAYGIGDFTGPKDFRRLRLLGEQNDRQNILADPLAVQFNLINEVISQVQLPAWCYGRYYNASVFSGNNIENLTKLNPALVQSVQNTVGGQTTIGLTPQSLTWMAAQTGFCIHDFSVDAERSIIKFSEATYQLRTPNTPLVLGTFPSTRNQQTTSPITIPDGAGIATPATLWLRTSFNVRYRDDSPNSGQPPPPTMFGVDQAVMGAGTAGWLRYERGRTYDSDNPSVRYVLKEDLVFRLTYRFQGPVPGSSIGSVAALTSTSNGCFQVSFTESNVDVIDAACDYLLDQIEKEYQVKDPGSITYIGFIPFALDGAIRQITWDLSEEGRATTRISRNREELHYYRSYEERRLYERLARGLHTEDLLPRQKAEDLRREGNLLV